VDLLAQLISHLSTPAQLWTPGGDVVATNRAFNELLGLDPATDWQAENRRFVDDPQLSTASAKPSILRALLGTAADILSLDYMPPRLGGAGDPPDSLRLNIRLRPLWREEDQLAYVLCTISDYAVVSERLEHDLMRSQKMENVERLASGVAHEFNNLFTGIRGLSELIRDAAPEGSEIAEYATLIGKNITRGAELIEKLSSFARELPHSLRRQNIGDYLRHVLPLLQLQAPKRLQLETQALADAPVLLDPNRMDQALASLISNAKDATDGTGTVRLTLRFRKPPTAAPADSDHDWVMLAVEDTGPGIPEDIREQVAQPFFTTKERGKSTGLGLSVTQRIIALHDGVLDIGRSEELGGASICIFLPVAKEQT
jgi:two-component system, cell cycle sensor histidine kinase and response regulator CckA